MNKVFALSEAPDFRRRPLLAIRACTLLLIVLFALVAWNCAAAAGPRLAPAAAIAPIPDAHGLAGMAAVATHAADGADIVLAAGGANFPDAAPWQGGTKVFHGAIYRLDGGAWNKIGELPAPRAYAAYAAFEHGMIIAGGADADRHFAETLYVHDDGRVTRLAPLPTPVAYAAFAVDNNRLYVIGGQTSPSATTALAATYRLDLTRVDPDHPDAVQWETLPGAPFGGRILSIAGALDGNVYVFGGCSLSADADGRTRRTYHADGAALRGGGDDPAQMWLQIRPAPLPYPLAAAAAPATAREGALIVIGGDDGAHYGQPPQQHPGQSGKVLAYAPHADAWSTLGTWPLGLATAPAVVQGDTLMTVSGEVRPGVRTPAVAAMRLGYAYAVDPRDVLLLVLGTLAVGLIVRQTRRDGLARGLGDLAAGRGVPGRAAWIAVGLLFFVAMLNYLDRQLLATLRSPIVRDIPQTDAQFGMLTAVFLFVYSGLSPFGGIFADRYSRRLVIVVSLVVWSGVTWLTGHVRSHEELFWARALMGVSEACYIPAALALITDYHRGSTRSLATGIHMSGVYLGQALAGVGAFVAQDMGWRLAFSLFGLIGVSYAIVLIVFLKEPAAGEPGADARAPAPPAPAIGAILAGVLRVPAFWLLMLIVACSGIANWFTLSWLPLLLQEKFNLSLGAAGTYATTPQSIAKYVSVITIALAADAWSRTNPKARSQIAGAAFLVAGPMVALCLGVHTLPLFVGCVLFQGLAQGALDATLMPILRAHVDGRFAATGYGFLNFVSAGVGGIAVVYGGRLKDAGIPLAQTLACSGAVLFFSGILLWLLPRPRTPL